MDGRAERVDSEGAVSLRPQRSRGIVVRILSACCLVLTLAACAGPQVGSATRPHFNPYWLRTDEGLHPLSLFRAHDDAELLAYVRSIADRLAAVDPDVSPEDLEIEIVDAGVVNAQVYRSRKLSLTLGLLALMQDEAELASVIAHELAHIAAKDAPKPSKFTATAATREAAREKAGQIAAAYSRQRELEADERGQKMMAAAGYDIGAMASAMRRLGADRKLGAFTVTQAQSSHPFGGERLKALATSNGGERRRDAFLDAIDGMAFRPPGQFALRAGGALVSLDHRLAFPVPDGFVGRSGSSSVSLKKRDGGVSLLVLARPRSPLPLEAALREGLYPIMVRDFPLGALTEVQAYQSFGGRPAVSGVIRTRHRAGGEVDLGLMAIDDGPRRLFGLAVAPAASPSTAFTEWRAFEEGIRPLADEEAAPFVRQRLKVVSVKAGQNVSDLAAPFGEGLEGKLLFQRLNGLGSKETLTEDRRVKTLQSQP